MNTNKKKILLLSTSATLIATSSSFLLGVYNNDFNSETSLIKNNSNINKSITNNEDNLDNLQNPNELIYISQEMNSTNKPVFNEIDKNIISENLKLWKKLSNNSSLLVGNSLVKDKLVNLYSQIEGSASLNYAIAQLEELAKTDAIISANLQLLTQQLIENSPYKLNMSEIEGIDNIKSDLIKLSGISEGNKIKSISNFNSFEKNDLIGENGSNKENIGINSIAGKGFKQLIKIAEIDPTVKGNYVLQFDYKQNSNSYLVSGNLIIKNDFSQLENNSNIIDLKNNLDVFGRYNLGESGVVGETSFKSEIDNFIIQKSEDNLKYEVLVRVKDGESLSNLRFATQADLPDVKNIAQPTSFGILDVQATDENTFLSIINNNGSASANNTKKLVSNLNNTINQIQFFGNSMTSKRISGNDTIFDNRSLEFYQAPNIDFSLPLYSSIESISDIENQIISYDPITIFQNGVDTKVQESLQISSLENGPSKISPESYELYSEIRDKLPEIITQNSETFLKASTITLNSIFHSKSKLTKQRLVFSDYFYALGKKINDSGWTSIDVKNNIKAIEIIDITDKIFFEKPSTFNDEEENQGLESKLVAQEVVNERNIAISILADVYSDFSQSNSNTFNGITYNLGSINSWVATNNPTSTSGYSNIKTNQINISGNAYNIYTKLNEIWNVNSSIMNSLFGTNLDKNRYDVQKNNSNSIVSNLLAKSNEFTVNSSQIEEVILNTVNLLKNVGNGSISNGISYDQLDIETKKMLANNLVELIKLQFGSIFNEFSIRQYEPVYDLLSTTISSTNEKKYRVLKNPNEIFETYTTSSNQKLISYKKDAWNNFFDEKTTTLSNSLDSLYSTLYYLSEDGKVMLGNSIFNSIDQKNAFLSVKPEDFVSFSSDSIFSKKNKVILLNRMLTFFGEESYNLQKSIDEMLLKGSKLSINFNLIDSFEEIINNVASNEPIRKTNLSNSLTPVSSFFLDDIISGANALILLNWKLNSILIDENNLVSPTINNLKIKNNNNELIDKINNILYTNAQADSSELQVWSRIVYGTDDFSKYSSILSGREGNDEMEKLANLIVEDKTILSSRTLNVSPAVLVVEHILDVFWWVTLSLIGAGILVMSTVGIVSKEKQIKLSSRPVLKWLMIFSILLGLGLAIFSILLGLGILL